MNEARTRNIWATVWCARHQTRTTLKRHNRRTNKKNSRVSGVVLVSEHMLQVCVHVKHVYLIVLLRVMNSVVVSAPTCSLCTWMWVYCNSMQLFTLQKRVFGGVVFTPPSVTVATFDRKPFHALTFFDFSRRQPESTALPPSGERTRCRFPLLVLPVGHGPELLSPSFSV